MGDRSGFTIGDHSYSPRPSGYQTIETQNDIRFSPHTVAGNMTAPPPNNPGPTRDFSHPGGETSTNLARFPMQQTQAALGSTHEQGTRRLGRGHPYHSTQRGRRNSTASSRGPGRAPQSSGGLRGADLPRNVHEKERKRRKKELRLQSRLRREEEELEASRRENRKPNINQRVEAITILDTQLKKRRGFLAMICPGMKKSAIYPHLLRLLDLEAEILPPGMAQNVVLPHGIERASRYIDLTIEELQYDIQATLETFKVLDDETSDLKVLMYLGKDFLDKHCGGDFPSDPYVRSQQNITAATTQNFGSGLGGMMAASATVSLETYGPRIRQSQGQEIAGAPMDPFSFRTPAPPVNRPNVPHDHQTFRGVQSPIRQNVAWPPGGSGTIPSNQLSTWQPAPGPGTNLNDPRQYLSSPSYDTYPYVDPLVLGVQFPEYTSFDTLYSAQQLSAPNYDHESTSDHAVAFGYHQGMESEQYAPFNHPQ